MKVDEAQAKLAAAEAALAATQRERDEVARMIEERRRLPVLPNIRIASPCPADWNQMIGDSRVRACAACKKNVFNLSSRVIRIRIPPLRPLIHGAVFQYDGLESATSRRPKRTTLELTSDNASSTR